MPTPGLEHARRQRWPYAEHFRELDDQQWAAELAVLKKMYEVDKLSIRRIAAIKRSSYGFMQARLVEAGANLAPNSTPYVPPARQGQP